MNNIKYVLFDDGHCPFPIICSEITKHSFIAECVRAQYPGIKVISAGFCNTKGQIWGESISLNLKSNPGDEFFIKKLFGIEENNY